jgi:hypothetical protein
MLHEDVVLPLFMISIFLQYPLSQSDVELMLAVSVLFVIENDFWYVDGVGIGVGVGVGVGLGLGLGVGVGLGVVHQTVKTGLATTPVPVAQKPASKLEFGATGSVQPIPVNWYTPLEISSERSPQEDVIFAFVISKLIFHPPTFSEVLFVTVKTWQNPVSHREVVSLFISSERADVVDEKNSMLNAINMKMHFL